MTCRYHPNVEASGSCGRCGVGLCSTCIGNSLYTWQDHIMCPDCNIMTISELAAGAEAERITSRNRIIFVSCTLVLGIIAGVLERDWGAFIMVAGLGGFFAVWRYVNASYSVHGDGMEVIFFQLLKVFIALFFGVLLSPILLFWAIFRYVKTRRDLVELSESLAILNQTYPRQAAAYAASSRKNLSPKEAKAERRRCVSAYFGPWKRHSVANPVSRAADTNHSRAPMSPAGMRGARHVHVISSPGRGTVAHNGHR